MANNAGVILRTARAVAGVTQAELARKAGIRRSRLSEMEHDHRRVRPEVALRLWQALVLDGAPAGVQRANRIGPVA